MELNVGKCKSINFFRIKNPIAFDYQLNGQMLKKVTVIKDLGVYFESSVAFEQLVEIIVVVVS